MMLSTRQGGRNEGQSTAAERQLLKSTEQVVFILVSHFLVTNVGSGFLKISVHSAGFEIRIGIAYREVTPLIHEW